MRVEQVDYETAARLRSKAAKDGVSVKDSKNTQWFGLFDGPDEIVGTGAVYDMGGRARLKGVWVDPRYRGEGHGLALTEARLRYIEDVLMASQVEVITRNHGDYWLSRGYRATGRVLPNGAAFYVKNL